MKSAALPARSNSPSSALLVGFETGIFPSETFFGVFDLEPFFALTKESPQSKLTLDLPSSRQAWRGCQILRAGRAAWERVGGRRHLDCFSRWSSSSPGDPS